MRIALTGTPGTGKTTVARLLPYKAIDINALVKEGLNLGVDPERGCLDADMDGLDNKLAGMDLDRPDQPVILEGHLSHYFADRIIVLRLDPKELEKRLAARGYSEKKIRENLEAEALDVILIEAVETDGRVDEIDTTGKTPSEVAELVIKILKGELNMPPGKVDWLVGFFDSK